MRHLACLLAALLFSCSHAVPPPGRQGVPSAPEAPEPDPALYDRLVIVGTNDFHGYLRPVEARLGGATVKMGGAEWFAGYARILERKFGDRLLLLDAGDVFQGTMESNLFHGASVMKYYNMLPYRASAVGNHEFDYGPRKKGDRDLLGHLKDRMAEARFPFLQANIHWKKSGQLWRERNLLPSVLVSAGGHRVGLIGLTTLSTPAKTLPAHVAALEFRGFAGPTIREAAALRAQGAEVVIVTMHEGGHGSGEPLHRFVEALPPGTIDAVVSGHSHTEIHALVRGVPVIQSKTRGLYFGRIDLFLSKATGKVDPALTRIHGMHFICGTWYKNQEDCDPKRAFDEIAAGRAKESDFLPLRSAFYEGEEVRPDPTVREALAPYLAEAEKRRGEVLGRVAADFPWEPFHEKVEIGGLFLDSFAARFPSARVIFLNGGGFRRRFYKGPLTYGDVYEVNPFDNFAVQVRMTGRRLKELLRVAVSGTHPIPSVRGVRVVYATGPGRGRDLNGDGKFEPWESDRLVSLVWEKSGKPVRDGETFWLATTSYLLEGGDNMEHVFQGIPPAGRSYSDTVAHDVLAEYLRRNPGIDLPRHYEKAFQVEP